MPHDRAPYYLSLKTKLSHYLSRLRLNLQLPCSLVYCLFPIWLRDFLTNLPTWLCRFSSTNLQLKISFQVQDYFLSFRAVVPYSYSLSKYELAYNRSDISFPSLSVNFFLHIVNPLREPFCWTFVMRTFIWVGLRSSPEMANSRLVVLVLRSLIMWPNLPESLVDYCSSSILRLSSSRSFSCSSSSWFFLSLS